MATSFQPNVHYTFGSPLSQTTIMDTRRVSGVLESDNVSSRVYNSVTSRRGSRRLSAEPSNLADVVNSLRRRNSSEMDTIISSKLINATHSTLIDWIRAERMSKLPPEGSSYDRVLVWASLFVERLHSFDLAVEQFAGDSHLAAQLVYGYCMLLLELGEENSSALMVMFGFFCSCSQELVNLLDRAELFMVSQDIKDQLVLALADLVTLVVCVSTQFHKSLRGISSESVSIDIYSSFPGPIESFRSRCEHVSGLMWRHQLLREGFNEATVSEIQTIKHWLEPEDPVLANVTQNAAHLAQDREELTCLWMTPYLTRFLKSNKKTLAISGKPGSGKTILSSVMIDHLQYPIGGVSYKPIFVPINSRVPAKTAPRGIVKTILSQIFDKRIGNVRLYQILADAYNRCEQAVESDDYDNIIWSALESALQASLRGAKELVLVVDGMDEASCGEAALVQRLKQATAGADNLKLILLGSQKFSTSSDQTNVSISPELIFDDIAAVVRRVLQPYQSFMDMSEEQREMTVNRITEAADGSFLWAKLACKQVKAEGSPNSQSLSKSVDSLIKAGYTVKDFVSSTLQSKTLSDDAKSILSWLITAPRPLALSELPALLSIHPEKGTITEKSIDPRQVLRPVSSLVFFQNGLLYLRHAQVRSAIMDTLGQGKSMVKERNIDMARRLLLYTKHCVTTEHNPTLTPLDPTDTERLLDQYPLLDFALRYWIDHATAAFGCTTDEEITQAVKELGKVMPTCARVPLLTMTIWQPKSTPVQVSMNSIQTRFYQQILPPSHPTTLQSVLCQALLYRRLHEVLPSKATWILYDAVKLCNDVLGPRNIVTLQMSQYFLNATAEEVTDSRTEIMMKRVQVLQVLVECYKMHYGEKNEMVMTMLTQLAEHYTSIKEESEAQKIYASMQETSGETSTQWINSRRSDDSLRVNLRGRQIKEQPDYGIFLSFDEKEEDELISATSVFNFESLTHLAETYKAQGKFELAENAYVEVWQRASKEYRSSRSTELELKNIQAVLAYARFLQSQNRKEEAASILAGAWQEHDQNSICTSQEIVSHLVEVARMMKSAGLTAMALNVFKHCAQYYESTSGYHSSSYKEIQESIQTSSTSVMQMVTSSTSSMTESNLKGLVYESINNMDATSISAANKLIDMYISQRRWHDATHLIKAVLRGIWPQLFATSAQDVALPSQHLDYCITLAERLSNCYRSRRRPSKEEDIRQRLYMALRRNRQPGDKALDHATASLLRLYQRNSQTDKVIHLHQEILSDYTKHYGAGHPIVVKKLWTLAELTSPRPISVDYYRQIVTVLNKNSDTCHPEAFEPLLIVLNDLWNKERYADALQLCKILFNTLRTSPKVSPKLRDQGFVSMVFNRYMQCLRATHADSTVIHDVAVQYRSTCQSLFGESASITVQSTITLANICQETTQYHSEAVQLYESLLTIKSDEVDYEDIRNTLDTMSDKDTMIEVHNTDSLSTEQLRHVITQRYQRLTTMRSSYGWAHEESLSEMEQTAKLYAKSGEFVKVASMLRDTTIKVLSTETSSIRLTAAAKSIASSYIASGQIQRGRELTQELYRQIVAKDTTNVQSVHFDMSSQQRQSLMFLAQLEFCLREDSSVTLNEIYSSLITEYMYFEQFRSEIRSRSSSVQSVTASAARLYGFLLSRNCKTSIECVKDQFAEFFLSCEGDRLRLSTTTQVKDLVVTLLDYFTTHTSQNFLRSVAIASYNRVCQLLSEKQYQPACDLALTSFKYIREHNGYSHLPTLKLGFKLGMVISGREHKSRPEETRRKTMLEISSTIMKETVKLFKRMKIDISSLGQENLNNLIGLLDEQQDYNSLAWVLTTLWDNRETPNVGQPYFIITLARMLIITRYLVGDYMAAMRLAEDIVYNCCRVHGTRHPNTFDMTVLLSQLYTSVAQRYQSQKDGREMAYRYYKKAAALHENALRAFVDPSSVEIEYASESGMESDEGSSTPSEALEDEGKHVRQHLHLLKHAVERLGGWPKDYSEYQRLSEDLFKAYPEDLKGVDGIEKWNLKSFGSGRAESSDDLVATGVQQGVTFNVRDLGGLAIAV